MYFGSAWYCGLVFTSINFCVVIGQSSSLEERREFLVHLLQCDCRTRLVSIPRLVTQQRRSRP